MTRQAYRSSGVNLDEMDTLKERIKAFASATHGPEVLNPEGGFAGLGTSPLRTILSLDAFSREGSGIADIRACV